LSYLAELAAAITVTANVKRYAEIVRDSSIERRLMAASQDIAAIIDGDWRCSRKGRGWHRAAMMAVLDAQSHAEPKALATSSRRRWRIWNGAWSAATACQASQPASSTSMRTLAG
jgi:hypothetical protein